MVLSGLRKALEKIEAKRRQEAAAEEFVSPCLEALTGDCADIAEKVDGLCGFLHTKGLPISEQSIPFITGVTYRSKQENFELKSIKLVNFLNYVSARIADRQNLNHAPAWLTPPLIIIPNRPPAGSGWRSTRRWKVSR